jgi:type IV secretory pathway TraG/TraD family ATPase VirD4
VSRGRPDTAPAIVVLGGAVAGVLIWAPVAATEPPGYTGGGPIAVATGLVTGDITWTSACTWWLVGLAAVTATGVAGGAAGWHWMRRHRTRVDKAARSMARRRDIAHLTGRKARRAAQRLQPRLAGRELTAGDIGPALIRRIGQVTTRGEVIHASMEDVVMILAGPRRGKTLTVAIPATVAHNGPAIVTGNKRDILDSTRGPRETRGTTWIFDPQSLALEPPRFWFNALAGCEQAEIAERYAGIFASADRPAGAKVDGHFDTAGRELISLLLQAAALGGRTVLDAYRWAMDSEDHDPEPVRLLADAGVGLAAQALLSKYHEPDKMRGSTFGTARTMLGCLTKPAVYRWVTPQNDLPQFRPERFVASEADTLYLLSEGGPGSPAPLLAIVNDAITEAAKARARALGGRCDPPILITMDEAANLVKDPDLPRKISFYGSMGLPLLIILQSYAQGEGVWGREGMDAMWSAANHVLILGGVRDTTVLDRLSQLIGDHDVATYTVQEPHRLLSGPGAASRSMRPERILPIDKLAALPTGRALLFAGGTRPVLGATLPWTQGEHAAAIRESIARYAPRGEEPPGYHPDSLTSTAGEEVT